MRKNMDARRHARRAKYAAKLAVCQCSQNGCYNPPAAGAGRMCADCAERRRLMDRARYYAKKGKQ